VKHTLTIFKRELRGYFLTPVAYIFIIFFLLLITTLTFWYSRLFENQQADLAAFFNWMPILFILFMPAVSMRLWAEERKTGTIELLMTLPVTIGQAVVGKFLAAWAFALPSYKTDQLGKTLEDFLAPLPITLLDRPELTSVLWQLGLRTLGDFAALDPSDVLGRFSGEGLAAHRRASGLSDRPPDATDPPEDMSNEHVYTHNQSLWDMRVLDLMRRGRTRQLIDELPDFIEQSVSEAKEGALAWLLSALQFPDYPAEVHAYGTVIGTGNAVVEWDPARAAAGAPA